MRFRVGLAIAAMCVCIGLATVPNAARATVPPYINYHGFLTDYLGNPLTGSHALKFALFADSLGGAPFWQESYGSVDVAGGSFAVMLGALTPLSVSTFSGATVWLETTVDGTALAPRRPMVSVGYAFRAGTADVATALASGGPGVIHTPDPRPGCPSTTPVSGVLFAQSIPLTVPASVMVSGHIARLGVGRVDLALYLDGVSVQSVATNTATTDWATGTVQWSGPLAAGAHTVELRSASGTTWGCGAGWGAIDTVVLK